MPIANSDSRTTMRGIGAQKTHIEISETAKLRRLYVLAALKTDTITDLKQAISKVWRKTNRPDTAA